MYSFIKHFWKLWVLGSTQRAKVSNYKSIVPNMIPMGVLGRLGIWTLRVRFMNSGASNSPKESPHQIDRQTNALDAAVWWWPFCGGGLCCATAYGIGTDDLTVKPPKAPCICLYMYAYIYILNIFIYIQYIHGP